MLAIIIIIVITTTTAQSSCLAQEDGLFPQGKKTNYIKRIIHTVLEFPDGRVRLELVS
jgi:hypothetical protein